MRKKQSETPESNGLYKHETKTEKRKTFEIEDKIKPENTRGKQRSKSQAGRGKRARERMR